MRRVTQYNRFNLRLLEKNNLKLDLIVE